MSVMIIEWSFSPKDFFEEEYTFQAHGCDIEISFGRAKTEIDFEAYNANPLIREQLHDSLREQFHAAELISYRIYELSPPAMTNLSDDGNTVYLEVNVSDHAFASDTVDLIQYDKDGNIICDSKKERNKKRKHLGALIAEYRSKDSVLSSLLQSYDKAIRNQDSELQCLYDIREALDGKFGDANKMRKALGISKAQYSAFGRICNDAPLKQGRHPGNHVGNLRDATPIELAEVRKIAQQMIEGYLNYLTSHT